MKKPALLAAKLDHHICIEQQQATTDPDYGTQTITWVTLATAWAEVQDVLPSRSEAVKNGLATATSQTRVRIRWRQDIDQTMRMTINRPTPTVYQIVSGPAEIGRHEWLEFIVEKSSAS